MGEYADALIDSMIDGCWGRFDVIRRPRRRAARPTCGMCGQKDLRWGNAPGGGWVLKTKDGEPHRCQSHVERFYGGENV